MVKLAANDLLIGTFFDGMERSRFPCEYARRGHERFRRERFGSGVTDNEFELRLKFLGFDFAE
jgi:hypothetical protein